RFCALRSTIAHSFSVVEPEDFGCRSSRERSSPSSRIASSCCPHSRSCKDRTRLITSGSRPRWLQSPTFDILNTCRQGQDFRQDTGAHFNAQAHISTQPASSLEDAWLPLADEDQIRSSRAEPPPCDRSQARLCQCWISRLSLPAV